MKIQKTKSAVKADTEILAQPEQVCNKDVAIEYIQSAIDALSSCALEHPEDTVVSDSIANLGVVLLDLKSTF